MARYCPFCNGTLEEIDNYGTEECVLCGSIFKLKPMEREDESNK